MSVNVEKALAAFRAAINRRVANYIESCTHAMMCAYVCPFSKTTLKSDFTPIWLGDEVRKVYRKHFTLAGKIFGKVLKAEDLTEEKLKYWAELAYTRCCLCYLCGFACPHAIENPPFLEVMRVTVHASGLTPKELAKLVEAEEKNGHSMLSKSDWNGFIEEVKKSGVNVPVDKKGARILYVPGYRDVKDVPNKVISIFKILNAANEDWTVSTEFFNGSLLSYVAGAEEIAEKVLEKNVKVAEKLGVESVLMGNADGEYSFYRWDATKLLGEKLPFSVVHSTELIEGYLRDGKLSVDASKNPEATTYHDPCHLARYAGVVKPPRYILENVVKDFREMNPNGIHNLCCMGGWGLIEVPTSKEPRMRAFSLKLEQIKETGAKLVSTACTSCIISLKEGFEHYKATFEVKDIVELVANALKS